jgi:hypothetical protein
MAVKTKAAEAAEKATTAAGNNEAENSTAEAGKGQETAKTEPTGQEETVLGINMASGQDVTGISTEGLTKAFETMSERLKEQMESIAKTIRAVWENDEMKTVREMLWKFQKMGMTDVQIRKMELWKRYYEEKAKMSNNERRRRGIPMVRRPKRQQYRTKKPDPAAADGRQQEKSEKVV